MSGCVILGESIDTPEKPATDGDYQLTQPSMIPTKKAAGVAFDPDVLEYLRRLCAEQQRDRSFIINAIIRHHAVVWQTEARKREQAISF
jgi:hypothetical protein